MPRIDSEKAERIVALYQKGTSPSELASRYETTPERIRTLLRSRGIEIRPSGRRTGWRKLSHEEIARRIRLGAISRTWAEYQANVGLP